jgi:hypothetical protein
MIKWFCDICKDEILAPANPVRVDASRCGKNRDDADIGWGGSDEFIRVWAHKECADALEADFKTALAQLTDKRTVNTGR